jgi:hypothetical protein
MWGRRRRKMFDSLREENQQLMHTKGDGEMTAKLLSLSLMYSVARTTRCHHLNIGNKIPLLFFISYSHAIKR